jgi:hypothetical protein
VIVICGEREPSLLFVLRHIASLRVYSYAPKIQNRSTSDHQRSDLNFNISSRIEVANAKTRSRVLS